MEFKRKIKKIGSSKGMIFPPDVIEYLNLEEETDMILSIIEGKYGEYIAIWRADQQCQQQ